MRAAERRDTDRTIRALVALLYTLKSHLRADWGAYAHPVSKDDRLYGGVLLSPEMEQLAPPGMIGYEHRGLGVSLELTVLVEGYIRRGFDRGWWHAPLSSQLSVQLNTLVGAYGSMETIRLTPVPVAHLIHQKQVLALFGAVLPFAMVTNTGWWAIPITTLVVFTLYGIDGIASELEDPFGLDRIDIPLDAIVEDIRTETLVMLDEWRRLGEAEGQEGKREEGNEWFVGEDGEDGNEDSGWDG